MISGQMHPIGLSSRTVLLAKVASYSWPRNVFRLDMVNHVAFLV